MLTRKIKECLEVIQIVDIIDQGVTCPARCRLSNNIDAIVKYPKNAGGTEVLINELVGNSIADLIGLTIPRYGVCEMPIDVIETIEFSEFIDSQNAGLSYFSELISNTSPINRIGLRRVENKETERLILFDHIIKNEDRHDGNFLRIASKDEEKVIFIDCSHFLTNHGRITAGLNLEKELSDEVILDMKLLVTPNNMYDCLCENLGYKENVLFEEADNIKKILTKNVMNNIRSQIPAEWITVNTERRIEEMFTILDKRIEKIDSITDAIAKERRKKSWTNY